MRVCIDEAPNSVTAQNRSSSQTARACLALSGSLGVFQASILNTSCQICIPYSVVALAYGVVDRATPEVIEVAHTQPKLGHVLKIAK
jgi:hypothetical protein